MTVLDAPFTSLSCFGVVFFRLFPVAWYIAAAEMVKKKNRNLIFYIHPRDIDPKQPKLDMPMSRMFKSYVNVGSALSKIDKILDGENYTCFEDVIAHTEISALPKAVVRTDKGIEQTYLSFEKKEAAAAARNLRSPRRPIRVATTK